MMTMQPIAEVELDETDLLFNDNEDGTDAAVVDHEQSSEAEDEEELEDAADVYGAHPETDTLGEHAENSAKSSTLHVSLEDTAVHDDDYQHGVPTRPRCIAASMPVTSHVRMGTSMPIAVPHMGQWKKQEQVPDSPTAPHPATFVPPHQLSHVNNFMFSLHGESPSVAIKRERLRARNAILKSTGFLEPGINLERNIGLQERNRLAQGGLTQALAGAGGP